MKKELNLDNLKNVSGGIVLGDKLHELKDIKGILILKEDDPQYVKLGEKARLIRRARIIAKGKVLEELSDDALVNTVGGRAILGNLPHNPNSVIIIKNNAGEEFAYRMPMIIARGIIARPEFNKVVVLREEGRALNRADNLICATNGGSNGSAD